MVIYTVCVNPERAKYMAVSCDDPDMRSYGTSHEEALGLMVFEYPGIKVDNAIRFDD